MRRWKFGVTWIFQWPQWWRMREYNWVNLYPIRIGVEAGSYKGRYVELEFVVLGVGFVAEAYHEVSRERFATEMEGRIREVQDGNYITLDEMKDDLLTPEQRLWSDLQVAENPEDLIEVTAGDLHYVLATDRPGGTDG